MKRIAYIINSIRNNGPSNVLINMIKEIDKKKYKVFLITIIDENDYKILNTLKKDVTIIEMKLPKRFSTIFKYKELLKIIDNLKIDIIHTHSHIPTIMAMSSKTNKITTVHCRFYEDFKITYGMVKGKIIDIIYKFSLHFYDDIICCSKSVSKLIQNKYKTVSYIYNGLNIQSEYLVKSRKRRELNIPEDATVYIYAGRLDRRKNVKEMVKKIENNLLNNEYLIILGNGKLYQEVKKHESNKIKVLGFKDNIFDYLIISDCLVSFSKSEGFPLIVIEALSSNLLLLVSDILPHKEFFEIDLNHYIGENFNKFNFIEKLNCVRKNIKKNRNTFEFYKKYLTAKNMMEKYEKVYEKY